MTKSPPKTVTISIDVMGGDLGPDAAIHGISLASKTHPNIKFILHGQEPIITPLLSKYNIADICDVQHADGVVNMDDKPSHVMRHGKNTSMWSAVTSVKDGISDACVSGGNTGALMAISMIRLRKLPGVIRPAISVLWPSTNPSGHNILLDAGADVKADPLDLLQYALMGASYARDGWQIPTPRIGLLNVGTEQNKGNSELKEAYELISEHADKAGYNFVGFVEGNDIASDKMDVIITDGFTGNVALKTAEGTAKLIRNGISTAFKETLLAKIGALFASKSLRRFAKKVDPNRANGGVFLGLNGTVVKSHGSANALGIASAIRLAQQLAFADFNDRLADNIQMTQGNPIQK